LAESVSLAKQVVYLAPGILAKLDADPAIRQAVLALMERDAELAAKTGQPIRADPQRARAIIATGGFRGLFEALKKGVPTASFSPPGRNDHSSPLGMRPRYTALP